MLFLRGAVWTNMPRNASFRADRPARDRASSDGYGRSQCPSWRIDIAMSQFRQASGADRRARGASTLLRTISIASRRSLGNTSLVTMAVTANNNAKSGMR